MATNSEPGGRRLAIGEILPETFQEFLQNIAGYLMGGLGFFLVAMPVGMLLGFVAVFVMYGVMIGGSLLSFVAGAAVGGGTGEDELGAIIGMFGSMGSMLLAFVALFALIGLVGAALAPLSASLVRAVAAHQRGEKPLELSSAFSTFSEAMWPAILTTGLVTVATIFGAMFCYVGALVPALLFGFAPYVAYLHKKGGFEALRISARHAMAAPGDHFLFILVYFGMSMVAAYIPVLGHAFLVAMMVRAYRRMYGDGPEPV